MGKHKQNRVRILRKMPKGLGRLMREKIKQSGMVITQKQMDLQHEINTQRKYYSRHKLTRK